MRSEPSAAWTWPTTSCRTSFGVEPWLRSRWIARSARSSAFSERSSANSSAAPSYGPPGGCGETELAGSITVTAVPWLPWRVAECASLAGPLPFVGEIRVHRTGTIGGAPEAHPTQPVETGASFRVCGSLYWPGTKFRSLYGAYFCPVSTGARRYQVRYRWRRAPDFARMARVRWGTNRRTGRTGKRGEDGRCDARKHACRDDLRRPIAKGKV